MDRSGTKSSSSSDGDEEVESCGIGLQEKVELQTVKEGASLLFRGPNAVVARRGFS